ncbi:nodal homolog [Anneissia japonica]|uniref:nodal homolog n=1 Tax=Anneissia japonica TaxID=1529436 RepID=UPI0014254FD9|nr:nodal homolog [Anneissia japonica]
MASFKMYLSIGIIFMLYIISVVFSFEAAFVRNKSGTSVSEVPVLELPSNLPALPGDFSQHTRDFQELFYIIMEDAKLNRMAQNSSTPTYMLDLYKSIKGPTASIRPTQLEASVIRDSDTVRSFLPQASDFEESQGRFSFNLSVIEPEEDIRLCELRIANKKLKWSSQNIRISIYQTCTKACEDPTGSEVCSSSTRISSLTLPLTEDEDEKQVVFDVTRSVRYALQIERSASCALEIILSNDEELEDPKSIDRRRREILGRVDITSGRFIPAHSPTAKQKQTDNVVLVVFTRDIKPKNVLNDAKVHELGGTSLQVEADMRRMRRDAKEDRKLKKERERNKEKKQQREKERADKLASELTIPTCRKVSFQINFDHIGWSRWIIYPAEFEAFRCEGSCTGPMKPHHNPSNHAVMQSLVNLKRPDLAPEVCCVPTKLVPLSMLYFEHGSIALKHHAEMIVAECGCR